MKLIHNGILHNFFAEDNIMSKKEIKVKKRAKAADFDDVLYYPWNYFWCAYTEEPYYNNAFVKIVTRIGKKLGNKNNKNSNYHRGIEYIVERAKVSKSAVKSIRKKFKRVRHNKYAFRVPYKLDKCIDVIIETIKDGNISLVGIAEEGEMYRDIIIRAEYPGICIMANENSSNKISDLRDSLKQINERY